MSIRTKLTLSSIAMVIIPVLSILVIDALLGFVMFVILDSDSGTFAMARFIGIILAVIVVNLTISYMLSKHLIRPVLELNEHTRLISEGNLDVEMTINRNDEIGELAESFDNMRQSLKEAQDKEQTYFKNHRELMASMSHDLKTPLTSIKGYVNGIEDRVADTPEKMSHYTAVIQQSAARLERMIDDLFMYSKLDLEEIDFNFTEVALISFIEDIINEYQHELETGQKISFNTDGNRHLVRADRQQLYRAVVNVLDNSIKYSGADLYIKIRLTSLNDKSLISVQDNGSGIGKEDLNYVFDSFYRTDQSRNSSTGGSGLGLSIVKRIIEQHNGEVLIDSKENTGTRVILKLEQVKADD